MDKEVQIATNKAAMKPQLSDKQKAEIDRHAADIERNEGAQAAKRYRYAQEDELLNEQAGQNYRLDGEGYAAALDALKEQFPYYIDDVEYTTRQKMVGNASGIQGSNFTNKEDYAYVKPRYNRPAAARSGYFDTTITGEGKRAADRTGYQNWAVQQHRTTDKQEGNVSARRVSETPEPGTPGAPTPTPDSDNDTPSSNLQQRSRQVRERRRESERQEEMRGAVENDAATWMPVNVEGKSLANATEHPNLTKYKDASPEQRKTMLDDPDFVDKLDADLTKVKGTPAAQEWRDLNSARVGRDRHDKAGMVREKYAKPLDYTEHIKGRRSPDRPGGISEEAAREVLRNDPSIQDMVRTQSDFQLRQQSDVARKARTDAKDSYEDKIAERHEKTVVKLEQARAIKAMMANNASPDRPVVHYQDPGNPGNPSGTTGGNRPGFSPSSGGASTNPKGPHLAAFRRQLDELLMEHGEEPDLNDRINRLKGHFITNTSLTDDDMEQTVVDAKFDDMDKRMRPS
jgi:hypothetical protein